MSADFYRVRTHRWLNGVLNYLDHFFDSFEDALSFAVCYECNSFKIFDCNDKIKHSSSGHSGPTYA